MCGMSGCVELPRELGSNCVIFVRPSTTEKLRSVCIQLHQLIASEDKLFAGMRNGKEVRPNSWEYTLLYI